MSKLRAYNHILNINLWYFETLELVLLDCTPGKTTLQAFFFNTPGKKLIEVYKFYKEILILINRVKNCSDKIVSTSYHSQEFVLSKNLGWRGQFGIGDRKPSGSISHDIPHISRCRRSIYKIIWKQKKKKKLGHVTSPFSLLPT